MASTFSFCTYVTFAMAVIDLRISKHGMCEMASPFGAVVAAAAAVTRLATSLPSQHLLSVLGLVLVLNVILPLTVFRWQPLVIQSVCIAFIHVAWTVWGKAVRSLWIG